MLKFFYVYKEVDVGDGYGWFNVGCRVEYSYNNVYEMLEIL